MKKLLKYLEKNGYNTEVLSFGYDYFTNAPEIKKQGVLVKINLKDAARYNKLMLYINRFNYVKVWDGINPDCYGLTLMNNTDYEDIEKYLFYRALSVRKCEELIHKYHTEPLTIDLNDECKKIMLEYGIRYNTALINAATA